MEDRYITSIGTYQTDKSLVASLLDQKFYPEVSPRVSLAECSHRLAVDVEGVYCGVVEWHARSLRGPVMIDQVLYCVLVEVPDRRRRPCLP